MLTIEKKILDSKVASEEELLIKNIQNLETNFTRFKQSTFNETALRENISTTRTAIRKNINNNRVLVLETRARLAEIYYEYKNMQKTTKR